MIYIDTNPLRATYGVEPIAGTFFNQLMRFPNVKQGTFNDWEERNGIEILESENRKVESMEHTISFMCDTISQYKTFISYLITQRNVVVFFQELGKSVTLEYMACTEFHDYRTFKAFGVKFREADPSSRINLNIFDETFDEKFN